MRHTPPTTPNPFTWKRFDNVYMGEHLLGEDIVDLAGLGFCGETFTVFCSICGELLGNIPVELIGVELGDITATYIAPVLDWHEAKHHLRSA